MSEYDRKACSKEIVDRISAGESLRSVCRDERMPSAPHFLRWVAEDADLAEQYARAMEQRADAVFDDLIEIADDGTNDWMEKHGEDDEGYKLNGEHVQRSKLRVDARKWALARMNPKKYGDKLGLDHSGGLTVNIVDSFADDT